MPSSLKQEARSGTDDDGPYDQVLRVLEVTLGRERPIPALDALVDATVGAPERDWSNSTLAIGLDANVVLRLAHKSKTEVVDYLATRHVGPLIVPGQVVQEFWNNTLAVIDTHSDAVRKKYDALADELRKMEVDFQTYADRFRQVLDDFAGEYAFVYEPGTATLVKNLLETLQSKAVVPFVPRQRFQSIAGWRERTRTPPGFKDRGSFGDFFVWADSS